MLFPFSVIIGLLSLTLLSKEPFLKAATSQEDPLLQYLQPDDDWQDEDESFSQREGKVQERNLRCSRTCVEGRPSQICYYRFLLEPYHTLGAACGTCPANVTACYDPQCVTADGFERGILTVNRRIPGPSIQVCVGDRIVVDVINRLPGRSTTIHWHGLMQKGTPYMDGVPMITQCPIPEGSVFRYDMVAQNTGTHFWHSHDGFQKMDGIVGALIIREPRTSNPNSHLYEHDLPSHVMVIADWLHLDADQRFPGLRIREAGQNSDTFLINGKGRYFPDMPPAPLVDLLSLPPLSNIISLTERFMGKSTSTPYSVFRVVPGARHRFRLIGATCLVCPAKVAIEDHNLLVIATDGTPIQPTLVDSIIILPGERYDVVIEAKESYRSSYWIHVRGLAACLWEGVHQVAILQYVGSKMIQPPTPYPGHKGFTKRNEVILNPDNADCGSQSSGICVDQLTNALPVTSNILKQTPDLSLILGFNFRVFTGQELFRSGTYHRFFQPPLPVLVAGQLNNISNMLPSSPILSQLEDIHPETFCSGNDSTLKECFHVIKIPLGAVVEFLLVDHTEVPNGLTHPFHLHGYEFAVLAVGLFKRGQTPEDVQRELHSGELKREKDGPPTFKDTIAIPSTGFAVVRIKADNPGYWYFHCHFLYHLVSGMSVVLQVGEHHDIPPVPRGFPKCGDYVPSD